MDRREALEKVLKAYEGYYNVKREQPEPPFAAEAEFRLHDENYFLYGVRASVKRIPGNLSTSRYRRIFQRKSFSHWIRKRGSMVFRGFRCMRTIRIRTLFSLCWQRTPMR